MAGVGEVDDDAQPVALLDDGRAEGGQAAQAGGLGVDVAERLDLIAFIVQQLEVPEPALVHLFHPLEVSFQEMRPFDRLDDGRLALVVCGLEVFQVHGAGQAVLSHQAVDRGEPLQEPGVGLAGVEVEAEGRADGRQPRALDLVGQVEVGL